jgi:hypothetical protein
MGEFSYISVTLGNNAVSIFVAGAQFFYDRARNNDGAVKVAACAF